MSKSSPSPVSRFRDHPLAIALSVVGVGGLLLMVVIGLGSPQPSDGDATDMNANLRGVGGPAELPLAEALPAARISQALAEDPFLPLGRPETVILSSDELGPVFRRDEGPVEIRIAPGQTFYEALAAREVAHEDIMTLVAAVKDFRNLRSVRKGEVFRIHITSDGGLRSLGFDLDEESHVLFEREGDTYTRQDFTYPVEHRLLAVGGTIDVSLYASLQEVGAPLDLAPKMSDILGWDVDFTRDLRRGDTFRIVYEEMWKDGKRVRIGRILATELVNRGRPRSAYLFTGTDGRPGYYDDQGNNLAKTLMRAPLEYSRISSRFSYRRFHPVLKRWMPHLGVDYAAPLGTPVRAAGDGTVLVAGHKKGNGRYIQIRHTNSEYQTYYLHLSRFAKGIKKGKSVNQGEIIGYVGATGYATGPHLDFRVKRNGKFVNPRKLKLPAAAPVSEDLKSRFAAMTSRFTNLLGEVALDRQPTLLPPLQPAEAPLEGPVLTARPLPAGIAARHN